MTFQNSELNTARRLIDAMYARPPLVFGHRGARAYAPMNTLPSFIMAADQGAYGVELDVHRSKDGYPVIVHDFVVDDTTNGKGRVIEMTLAELKALDAGSWFGSQYAGTQIPTLDEVFEAVGHRLFVNVEIKAEFADSDGVEQVVADCISRHNMQERVLITSFNPPTLNRFRALMPSIPIGYLYEGDQFKALPTDASYEAYNPYYELIDPAMIEACRAQQIYINVWTMNDPARAVDLARLGVAGIITDNPDTVIAALKAAGLGE